MEQADEDTTAMNLQNLEDVIAESVIFAVCRYYKLQLEKSQNSEVNVYKKTIIKIACSIINTVIKNFFYQFTNKQIKRKEGIQNEIQL